jgi:hypothetical protein
MPRPSTNTWRGLRSGMRNSRSSSW